MTKKLILAAFAAGLFTTATLPLQLAPAMAGDEPGYGLVGMSCKDAAKMAYPDDRKMRRDWRKACKEAWKAAQGS